MASLILLVNPFLVLLSPGPAAVRLPGSSLGVPEFRPGQLSHYQHQERSFPLVTDEPYLAAMTHDNGEQARQDADPACFALLYPAAAAEKSDMS